MDITQKTGEKLDLFARMCFKERERERKRERELEREREKEIETGGKGEI